MSLPTARWMYLIQFDFCIHVAFDVWEPGLAVCYELAERRSETLRVLGKEDGSAE